MMTDKLVLLQNSKNIIFEPVYFNNGLPGAIDKCYMRETVAKKIINIADGLPNSMKLKIFDAWRPLELQEFLFNDFKSKLKMENPEMPECELFNLAKEFVCPPYMENSKVPVHCTGGAVDLTLVDKFGNDLDMGTGFDDFSEKSNTNYFEMHNDNFEAKNNRRLLLWIMTKNGFTNFESEWWHYDFGDRFWAKHTKTNIIYDGIFVI